jgi:hypothetical protein
MGDFNYNDISWDTITASSSLSDSFLIAISDCVLTQHILVPTRQNAELDLVISSDPDLVHDMDLMGNLDNSDHNMLSLECFLWLHLQPSDCTSSL